MPTREWEDRTLGLTPRRPRGTEPTSLARPPPSLREPSPSEGRPVMRPLRVNATSSAALTGTVIGTPDEAYSGPGLAMLALTVYVCPGSTTCPTTNPALKVKVGVADPNGDAVAGKRQVTIYNWCVQRT